MAACGVLSFIHYVTDYTAVHNLIPIQVVVKQLHSLSKNTAVGVFTSLTTSIESEWHKIVKLFHRGLLNETINHCSDKSMLHVKKYQLSNGGTKKYTTTRS